VGQFDFGNLTTENIERVEILRGAGGTLYGSQAVGGVVNLITRQGRGRPRLGVSGEGGNGSTGRGVVTSAGQIGRLHYSIAGAYLDTQGFRPQNDDYRNGTASLRVDYDVSEHAVARVFFRYTNADLGLFNNNNFLAAPDPNARMSDELFLVKAEWEQEVLPDLELRFVPLTYTHEDQEFDDPPDAAETSRTTSEIPTAIGTSEIQANHYWRRLLITTAGIVGELRMANDVRSRTIDPAFEFSSRFDESRYNVAGYLQEQLRLLDGALLGVGGVRVDGNQNFGTEVSPAGSASYRVPDGVPVLGGLRAKLGYAEGFKAPTFNELFFPDFGNPDLDAETSREYDAGLVRSLWAKRASMEVTFFDRRVSNLIEGAVQEDGSFRAENRGDTHVRGVELAPRVTLWRDPDLTLVASYTRLETVSKQRLLRRPKDRGAVTLNLAGRDFLRPRTRYHLNVNLHVVGDRVDVNPPAAGLTCQGKPTPFNACDTNPAYATVDLAGSYTFEGALSGRGDLTLFAKAQNLLDADYDEVLGFRAPPINFLAGVRAAF
jgi:vitamin B12 transporter